MQATRMIYTKEGLPGFMRGFTPSVLKNTLNAGTYFSVLFYAETLLMRTGLLSDHSVHFWASAYARTI